jgi:hypothetical protein
MSAVHHFPHLSAGVSMPQGKTQGQFDRRAARRKF